MPVAINGVSKQGVGVNGVQVKQALAAGSETVAKGVYAETTLSTIDADLASANIKSGITIFGKAGAATVQDIADADALVTDVKNPKTFYSVTGARKTGTLATVALNPALNAYPAGYHAGAASLTAVDADLVAANIKNGIVIFGVTGTFTQTLSQDLVDKAISVIVPDTTESVRRQRYTAVGANWLQDLASITKAYDANSMAVGVAQMVGRGEGENTDTLRLYMDGVLVAESAGIITAEYVNTVVVGTRALSGSKICKATLKITTNAITFLTLGSSEHMFASISVGSIKKV